MRYLPGGHLWRIKCYPLGIHREDRGKYLSVFIMRVKLKTSKLYIFEVFVMDRDGAPLSSSHRLRSVHVYKTKGTFTNMNMNMNRHGWTNFVKRNDLDSLYSTNGTVTIMCGVKVLSTDPIISVPPSDMARHLGILLDSADGSDVSFVVGGEEFPAHRTVLAASSPVFKVQLLGPMADAKMSSITLHDIVPTTFRLYAWVHLHRRFVCWRWRRRAPRLSSNRDISGSARCG